MKKFKEILSENKNTPAATLAFIKIAHGCQMYSSSIPYWKHPLSVAETGKKFFGVKFGIDGYCSALLHDVIEDTEYTEDDLRKMGYNSNILSAVALCTKDKTLSYDANIDRIITSGNKTAMMVKWSDNYQNFHGDKSHWPKEKADKSNAKYSASMKKLETALEVDLKE